MSNIEKSSRREFLQRSGGSVLSAGAGILLPTILTSRALGATGFLPASERIRIGCIGVGNQGMGNLKALNGHVVAVCDVDKTHAEAAKAHVEKSGTGKCAIYHD